MTTCGSCPSTACAVLLEQLKKLIPTNDEQLHIRVTAAVALRRGVDEAHLAKIVATAEHGEHLYRMVTSPSSHKHSPCAPSSNNGTPPAPTASPPSDTRMGADRCKTEQPTYEKHFHPAHGGLIVLIGGLEFGLETPRRDVVATPRSFARPISRSTTATSPLASRATTLIM